MNSYNNQTLGLLLLLLFDGVVQAIKNQVCIYIYYIPPPLTVHFSMTRSVRYQPILHTLYYTLHTEHAYCLSYRFLNNVITTVIEMVEMVEILNGRLGKRSVERIRYVINNLLHLVIVKYGDISLVLCISTRLRLVTILSLLVKYLVILHADPCNKSYIYIYIYMVLFTCILLPHLHRPECCDQSRREIHASPRQQHEARCRRNEHSIDQSIKLLHKICKQRITLNTKKRCSIINSSGLVHLVRTNRSDFKSSLLSFPMYLYQQSYLPADDKLVKLLLAHIVEAGETHEEGPECIAVSSHVNGLGLPNTCSKCVHYL